MKKLIYIGMLFVLFCEMTACTENEMKTYAAEDAVTFVVVDDNGSLRDDKDHLVWEKNWGVNPRGEALKEDTLEVRVKVLGKAADYPRRVAFKLKNQDSAHFNIRMLGEYTLPAGEYMASFKLLIARPAKRDSIYKGELLFDYTQCDFIPGVIEQQSLTLRSYDIVNMQLLGITPYLWQLYSRFGWGTWSAEKARFMMTVLQTTRIPTTSRDDVQKVKQALEEYKSNPENPPLYDETKFPDQVWISF